MEVHAHSHTERKKWYHYFWEFLMLFLAVFCGFLAENLREHQIEKQREKQFMHSLKNDIMADTARLNTIIRTRNQREIWLDSLSFIMNSKNIRSYPTGNIYYYAVYVPRSVSLHFLPNDGTLQQLKNSGSLRLIHNAGIVDSITHYDVQTRNLIKTGEVEEDLFQDYRIIVHKFFDGVAFDAMLDADNQPHRITFSPELYSFSAEDLHQFNYKLFSIKAYNRAIRRESKQLLEQAKNLLTLLKEAYNL